jgi:hypothetical protein
LAAVAAKDTQLLVVLVVLAAVLVDGKLDVNQEVQAFQDKEILAVWEEIQTMVEAPAEVVLELLVWAQLAMQVMAVRVLQVLYLEPLQLMLAVAVAA